MPREVDPAEAPPACAWSAAGAANLRRSCEDAAAPQDALNFTGNFESIIHRKMFKDMLTECSVKRAVWERQSAGDIDHEVNVLVRKPIDIDPMYIIESARAGTQIQIAGGSSRGHERGNSCSLARQRIPESQ